MRAVIYSGDCLDVLPGLADEFVDAVVTDPPYDLTAVSRNGSARVPGTGPYGRHTLDTKRGGFMGKEWDGTGIAFRVELWAECFRVLKPGGHLLAFGGTRTSHRLTCAIEDAGFEIRDEIAWIYGSGFPKSLDVSKAIDKTRRRDYVNAAINLGLSVSDSNFHDWTTGEHSPGDVWWEKFKAVLPESDWQAIEREVIAERSRKATGRMAQGDGGYAFGEDFADTAPATDDAKRWAGWGTALKPAHEPIVVARKPLARGTTVAANVLAHGTGALNIDACRIESTESTKRNNTAPRFNGDSYAGGETYAPPPWTSGSDAGRWPTNVVLDDVAAAELDEQSGTLKSGANPTRRSSDKFRDAYGEFAGQAECTPARGADVGGASRFFPVFRYQAKAPTRERPKVDGVAHPTVKPLELMRWLVRLVTPVDGIVMDLFGGSGTTGEAAVLEGMRCIVIEREPTYHPLIAERMARAGLVTL